jgi:acetyltransferase-like isoleucine patch superfamily enzyme
VEIRLGPGAKLDQGVMLGYPTGRPIEPGDVVIGRGARIRSNTVIYCNVIIGDGLETGHNVTIREENRIGDNLRIWNNSTIDYGCSLGHNVRIHNNVYVAQNTIIEDDVFLAPGAMIANDMHPICTECMQGPTIRRGARIGVNVTLLPRITIGEYAVVGAGSVVTRDVPPRTLVYGNPARVMRPVDDLECPLHLVEHPYVRGLDVSCRASGTGERVGSR